jgi:hypothetical protein
MKWEFPFRSEPFAGWTKVISTSGTGTTVTNDPTAAHSGLRGMRSIDDSTTKTSRQRAGIEYALPAGRFEWLAEGWFNPIAFNLDAGQTVDLLHFRNSGTNLSVAARIYQLGDSLQAGIIVKNPDGTLSPLNSMAILAKDTWRKWKLHVLRIGMRETTAMLSLDD